MRAYHVFETAFGYAGIVWSHAGIARFQLPAATAQEAERLLLRRIPAAKPVKPEGETADIIAAVIRYFDGEEVDFSTARLDLGNQDAFLRSVYDAARRVGWGHTTTYGTLSKQLGTGPEGARDVGQAMAKNPVALLIPCHRVLAAGNRLGGFSAPGGTDTKRHMLELEGVHLPPPKPQQQQFGF